MQAKVYDLTAKEVGKMTLKDEVFAAEFNKALIHQVVVASLANARQGTKSTLTRTEVSGGGKKPWRQKGTGRARQGSTRSPQWTHGGVVFAPKPRDFSQKVNKRMKKAAFISAISTLFAEGNVFIVDKFELKEAKTKNVKNVLDAFKVDKKALIVTDAVNENVVKAGRNIPGLTISNADVLSTIELANAGKMIIVKDAVKKLEEAYV